ncbi:MAG: hypothetical protein WAS21_07140 [Geminicoccaceae bacterium]
MQTFLDGAPTAREKQIGDQAFATARQTSLQRNKTRLTRSDHSTSVPNNRKRSS